MYQYCHQYHQYLLRSILSHDSTDIKGVGDQSEGEEYEPLVIDFLVNPNMSKFLMPSIPIMNTPKVNPLDITEEVGTNHSLIFGSLGS